MADETPEILNLDDAPEVMDLDGVDAPEVVNLDEPTFDDTLIKSHITKNLGEGWRIPMAIPPAGGELTTPPVVPPSESGIMPYKNFASTKKQTTDLAEAVASAMGFSTVGLMVNKTVPDTVVSPDASFGVKLAAGAAGLAGDLPTMLLGGAEAAAISAGRGMGPLASAAAGVVGAWSAPAALRSLLIAQYERGDIQNAKELMIRVEDAAKEGGKAFVIGTATGGAGKLAQGMAEKIASPLAKNALTVAAETGVMTTIGAALDQHMPELSDFAINAMLIGGLHAGSAVQPKLFKIYKASGVKPEHVAVMAESDPVLKQELLSNSKEIPSQFKTAEAELLEMTPEEYAWFDGQRLLVEETKYTPSETQEDMAAPKERLEPGIALENVEYQPELPLRKSERQLKAVSEIQTMPIPAEKRLAEAMKADPAIFESLDSRMKKAEKNISRISELERLSNTPEVKAAEELVKLDKKIDQLTAEQGDKKAEYQAEIARITKEWGRSKEDLMEKAAKKKLAVKAEIETLKAELDELRSITLKDKRRIARAYAKGDKAVRDEYTKKVEYIPIELEPDHPVNEHTSDMFNSEFDGPPAEISTELKIELAESGAEQREFNFSNDNKTIEDMVINTPELGTLIDIGELGLGEAKPPEPPTPPSAGGGEKTPEEAGFENLFWDGKPVKEGTSKAKLYSRVVDDLYALAKIEKDIFGGELPSAERSGYKQLRMAGDYLSSVYKFIRYGAINANGEFTGGKSYTELYSDFKNDKDELLKYKAARRIKELREMPRGEGEKPIKTNSKITDAEVEATIKAGDEKFKKAVQEQVAANNAVLDMGVEFGLVSKKAATEFKEKHKWYYPIVREKVGGVSLKGKSTEVGAFKKITGSEKRVLEPHLAEIRKLTNVMRAGKLNRAKTTFVENVLDAKSRGELEDVFFEKVDYTKGEARNDADFKPVDAEEGITESVMDAAGSEVTPEGIVTIVRDGKIERYKTDPETALALNMAAITGASHPAGNNPFTAVLSAASKLQKSVITTFSASFPITNYISDQVTAGVFAKYGTKPFIHSFEVVSELLGKEKSKMWLEYLSSGAGAKEFERMDNYFVERDIFGDNKVTGELDRLQNIARTVNEKAMAINSFAEQMTRYSVYKAAIKKGATPAEAAFQARESTLDFSRGGVWSKEINRWNSFFNVSIQGADRLVRAFKDGDTSKRTLVQAGLFITLPKLLEWAINKDDPLYQELDDRRKDMFLNFKVHNWVEIGRNDDRATAERLGILKNENGKTYIDKGYFVGLPLGRELGAIFGGLTNRLVDSAYRENPRAFDGFSENLISSFMPGISNPIMAIGEVAANRNIFTGRDIVPEYLMDKDSGVLPKDRALRYTSETAKLISRGLDEIGLGNKDFIAPANIDHLMLSWSSTFGRAVVSLLDTGIEAAGLTDQSKGAVPEKDWRDNPFMRAFITKFPQVRSDSLKDLDNKYAEYKQHMNSAKLSAKQGNLAGQREELLYMKEHGLVADIETGYKAIANVRKAINTTLGDKNMSASDKAQMMDKLNLQAVSMARKHLADMDLMDKRRKALNNKNETQGE